MKIDHREKNKIWLLYIAAMLIPCMYLLLWYVLQGHSFLAAKPYYSDELGYWRVMFSVKNCGFAFGPGGGFVGHEASVGPLGSHGLSPLFAWGWYALLFPWTDSAIFIADFVMLTASIGAYMLLVRPEKRETLFVIAALLLYAPAALYINTCMMEIPCMAAVILFSGLYIRWRKKREKAVFAAALVMGVILAMLRICYAALLLPLLWEKWDFALNGKTLGKMAVFAAVTVLLYVFSVLFMIPYPHGFEAAIGSAPLSQKPIILAAHCLTNIKAYFKSFLTFSAESTFRWLYMAVMLYFLYKSLAKGEKKRLYFSLFAVYAAHLAAVFVIYDVFGWLDYRTLSPALIMAILFIGNDGESRKSVKAAVLVFTALTFASAFHEVISDGTFIFEERFEPSPDNRAAFSEVFGDEIASVSTMSEDGVFDRIKDIPPQIGVRWMLDEGGRIRSNTEFIMIGGDDREVAAEYEFIGRPAEKCYVYKRTK